MSARTLPEKYRLAHNIQPGWEVLCIDEDGNDEWCTVKGWFRYDSPVKASFVELRFTDGSATRALADADLMTRRLRAGADT